jgi:hypothetical protein
MARETEETERTATKGKEEEEEEEENKTKQKTPGKYLQPIRNRCEVRRRRRTG